MPITIDPVVDQARAELRAAGIPTGQIHDLRDATIERGRLRSVAPDPVTVAAYLRDPRMPARRAGIAR